MKFRTEVQIPVSETALEIDDRVFSIGSCFSSEMSDLLKTGQIQTLNNPFGTIFSRIIIILWALFALSLLGVYVSGHIFSRRTDILIYCVAFACSLVWYFSLEARQDRDWNPEVAQVLTFEQQNNQVTLHNVRNFSWHEDGSYEERWETRHFDLNQITGVNIITSYWMWPHIAHTLP